MILADTILADTILADTILAEMDRRCPATGTGSSLVHRVTGSSLGRGPRLATAAADAPNGVARVVGDQDGALGVDGHADRTAMGHATSIVLEKAGQNIH